MKLTFIYLLALCILFLGDSFAAPPQLSKTKTEINTLFSSSQDSIPVKRRVLRDKRRKSTEQDQRQQEIGKKKKKKSTSRDSNKVISPIRRNS